MADQNKINQSFTSYFNIDQMVARIGKLPGNDKLLQLERSTTELSQQGVRSFLSEQERLDLSGKRSPVLREVMLRCGEAVAKHPDITQATGIDQTTCLRVVALDSASMQIIQAAGETYQRGTEALRTVSAESQDLGRSLLTAVAREMKAGAPFSLQQRFGEAVFNHQASFTRQAAAEERAAGATAADETVTAEALAHAAEARDIARFLLAEAGKGGAGTPPATVTVPVRGPAQGNGTPKAAGKPRSRGTAKKNS